MDELVIDTSFLDDEDFNEADLMQQTRMSKYDIHDDSNVKLQCLEPAWFMRTELPDINDNSQKYLSKSIQAQIQQQIEYIYAVGQNFEKCIELIQLLLQNSKPLVATRKLLYDLIARCLIKHHRPEEAISYLKKLIQLCNQNFEAYRLLADCYLQTGQMQECLDTFAHILKLASQCPETWDCLSQALSMFGFEYSANLAAQKCVEYCDSMMDRYGSARSSIPFYSMLRQKASQRILHVCSKCTSNGDDIPAALLYYLQRDSEINPEPDVVIMNAKAE